MSDHPTLADRPERVEELRVLGETDGDALAAMGNLAAILWQHGERGEAYWLQHEIVETQRRARGDNDPTTRACVAVLETMQKDSELS